MNFVDLKKEDILNNFKEIFRKEPFYSESSKSWIQDAYGSCYDLYILDRRYFNQDLYKNKDDYNISSHFYQDITNSYNFHFYQAYQQGLINKEIYDQHKEENVYYHCHKDDDLLHYQMHCPKCGQEINIYLNSKTMTNSGGVVPVCPYCGQFQLSLNSRNNENTKEVRILELMPGVNIKDPYSLYPVSDSSIDRIEYLSQIILKECENLPFNDEEKLNIIRQVCKQNDTILHIIPAILKECANSYGYDRIIELLQDIKKTDDGNTVLSRYNIISRQNINHIIPPMPVLTNNQAPVIKQENRKAKGFCKNCGAKVYEKFCPECGTLFE